MTDNDTSKDATEDPTPVAFTRPMDQLAHSRDDGETMDADVESFTQRRVQENYRPKKHEG